MLAILLDAGIGYLLHKHISRWLGIIPLAIVFGIINAFVSNYLMHLFFPNVISAEEAVTRAFSSAIYHPLVILAFVWGDRRYLAPHRKDKRSAESTEPAHLKFDEQSRSKYWVSTAIVLAVIFMLGFLANAIFGPEPTDILDPDNENRQTTEHRNPAPNPALSDDALSAVEDIKLAAKRGNVAAQYSLGHSYSNGTNVTQDYDLALKWYQKAAEKGHALAQSNLGMMYANGKGVSQDYNEAVRWFLLSAQQGSAHGQNNVGTMYYRGNGVPQNYNEALKWYHQAAVQGHDAALYGLGDIYAGGDGVVRDPLMAHMYFNLAAAKGFETASSKRNKIAQELTVDQLAKAQQIATDWMETHP